MTEGKEQQILLTALKAIYSRDSSQQKAALWKIVMLLVDRESFTWLAKDEHQTYEGYKTTREFIDTLKDMNR